MTADDLGVGGALTVLMRDAIEPTLMQVGRRAGRVWGAGSGWGCGRVCGRVDLVQ